jgi:hypothetical protein
LRLSERSEPVGGRWGLQSGLSVRIATKGGHKRAVVALARKPAVIMRACGATAATSNLRTCRLRFWGLDRPELTPGDAFYVTIEDICTPGYAKKIRSGTKPLRDQAFKSYGVLSCRRGEYQLDHLIPLALGGSNSIKNLWPQPNNTSPWNARVKDALEVRLHKLVCRGQVDLEAVQRGIATDWTEAYRRYIGTRLPVAARASHCLLRMRPTAKRHRKRTHRAQPKTRCG